MNKKAVVMISGGLDSTLAAKLMLDQGVELCGVYMSAPWGCCDKTMAMKVATQLGIDFMVIKMTDDYIRVIRSPKYGYGSSMNPCIDCRIYMFEKAKEWMEKIGASFLITGEVLGQRPMSQMRNSMSLIEKQAGLEGRIVRPLSAKLLPPSLAEEAGVVDREKMLAINGRSRKEQMELAIKLGILEYPNPAGGCLLTDHQFGLRVKDLFNNQDDVDLDDMELLRWGRHFRVDPYTKLLIGRNEQENATLEQYLAPGRALYKPDFAGPSVLMLGPPNDAIQKLALRLIAHYAGQRRIPENARVAFRPGLARAEQGSLPVIQEWLPVEPATLSTEEIEKMRID